MADIVIQEELKLGEISELGVSTSQITQYIKKEWGRRIALSIPKFYEWQFLQCPGNSGVDKCVVLVDGAKEIYGYFGLNRRTFNLSGTSLDGMEMTISIVSEQLRGCGYGRLALEYLHNYYDLIMGASIAEEKALPSYMPVGLKYIRYLPRYVRVFNLEAVSKISEISGFGRSMIQRQQKRVRKDNYAAKSVGYSHLSEQVEYLHLNYNCFSRDLPYLKWRYAEHPIFSYEFYQVESGQKKAAVILRMEQKEGLRFMHVIDILGDERCFPSAINFIEELCYERNTDFVDFYCLSDKVGHVFWSHGWFSIVNDYYIQIPRVFYPIELTTPATTSVLFGCKSHMEAVLDTTKFYFTKGDCDLDRPTVHYLEEKGISL